MNVATERLLVDGLTVSLCPTPSGLVVIWRGFCDARNPGEAIGSLLATLLGSLTHNSVTLDFCAVEFINSASVAPLVNLIKGLDAKGVRTLVLYDHSINWQRVNFLCMKTIARTLRSVEVRSK